MSDEVESHVLERYELLKKMGKGAYGVVWKARDRSSNQLVALKKIYDAFQNSTDAQRTYREVMYLKQLNGHENIIKLLNVIHATNNKDLYIVFELMETDLHVVIRAKILSFVHKKYILYQLFKALKYLHSAELVHRDLKPSNMLINSDCVMKLADFGLARSVSADEEGEPPVVSDYIATRWYRAPEILLGSQRYSLSVDLWSAGCIMGEILLEKVLFPGKSSLNQLEIIIDLLGRPSQSDLHSMAVPSASTVLSSIMNKKSKSFGELFVGSPPEAIDLLRKILVFNPKNRPTVEQVLAHPFFEKFHNTSKEPRCMGPITIPINDNQKLSLKAYREALYRCSPTQNQVLIQSVSPQIALSKVLKQDTSGLQSIHAQPKQLMEKRASASPEIMSKDSLLKEKDSKIKKFNTESHVFSITSHQNKENRSPIISKNRSQTQIECRNASSLGRASHSKTNLTTKISGTSYDHGYPSVEVFSKKASQKQLQQRSPLLIKKRETGGHALLVNCLSKGVERPPQFSVSKVDGYFLGRK